MLSGPHPAADGSTGLSPGASLAAFALGTLAIVSSLVWTAGEAAALLASGEPLRSGVTAAPGTLFRLTKHGSDPALAWPAADRTLLPGPVVFYAIGLVLLALLLGGLLVALRVYARIAGGAAKERDARFARPRDLRALRVRGPEPGRVTLGRAGSALLAAESRQSVLVVGPTQTGKTSGLAIPAMLEWAGPVIATSIKTDLLRDTITSRTMSGRVFVFDPTGSTGMPGASWTPLTAATSWAGAQRVATSLVEAGRPSSAGIEDPEFWLRLARKLLAPLLLAASTAELSIADVVRWVDTQEDTEVRWILEEAKETAALQAFEASINRDLKTRGGAYATAETILEAYADPTVLASAMTSEITPEAMLDGSASTLYLCAPAHEQRRLQPLFAALISELVNAVAERSNATGQPLDPPLLLVLDECANIAPLRSLDALASSGAGQGIQLVSVFQDIAQITTVYGSERARTILANHRAMLLLAGITDPETLEHVSRIIGDEPSREHSQTRGHRGEHSTTESTRYLSLMPPNALRQMRPGEALLIYGHTPPTRLTLRPWYREHSLRTLAGMPPANRLWSWRVLGVAGAALVALLVVATAAIGSGAIGGHASADGPAPLSIVHCGDAVESQPSLATLNSGGWHYRSILGRVALPVANAPLAPVAVTGDILPFWSKFKLLVLTGATPVEISVAPASVERAALAWGDDAGPATKIRVEACASIRKWLAYPGGALVKSPGCLPLIIRVGTRRARIRLDASAKKNACALR